MILMRSLIFICLAMFSQLVHSHAMGSSFLHITEESPGKFALHWVPAKELKYLSQSIEPQLPKHCPQNELIIDCGEKGLVGTISFANLPMHNDTVVRIEWLNGNQHTEVITNSSQSLVLTVADNGASSWLQVLYTYTAIGIEHILLGIDHLLFVVGLILLVGFQKQLVWVVTAFTIAHSITLALSVTGAITISQTPVEIIIALSIMLVAVEVMNKRITLARRQPWLVAFIFGLVHGLGFAGALREVGLPDHELPLSLLAFNLGVEIGQLGVILGLYMLTVLTTRALTPRYQLKPAVVISTYIIGSLGAYWTISRGVGFIGFS